MKINLGLDPVEKRMAMGLFATCLVAIIFMACFNKPLNKKVAQATTVNTHIVGTEKCPTTEKP